MHLRLTSAFLTQRHRRGAALLAVLWVIALLIGLVAATSLLLMQDIELAATKRQVFRARMLSEAALAIAMNPDIKPDDPLLRRKVAEDEEFIVEMTGEDGLINPNVLLQREDKDTLRRIFLYWGMNVQQANTLIDRLLDWVDADDMSRVQGGERKLYNSNGMPFNRPFRSVEEMALVSGMELVEEGYPQWREWFSVYGSGVLDLNEAQPEIIAAVTGTDIRYAQNLRSQRLGRDGILNTLDDTILDMTSALAILGIPAGDPMGLANILSVQSSTRRILVKVRVGDLERQTAAVVRGALGQGTTTILWMGER
ncbi:type II secretory pathway component PulK [Prosthecobacter fusiformis]|uniref:Type II secretory pathway component PulK n=1 Tax=Prosthecobacter fusiformis TaxID=48464 RepID=A0A4R7SQD2_9BACT|nr:type II secretion system protein GspK [Prosthecobacter fusiformis]TDU81462.1 type II secretory pathway component PulK [Prosthecobacter fusiformis]